MAQKQRLNLTTIPISSKSKDVRGYIVLTHRQAELLTHKVRTGDGLQPQTIIIQQTPGGKFKAKVITQP